jgi:shikimate dehydrogenase
MPAVDAHTRLITLLGYPIEHTLSPLLHNTAFEHQDLNYIYVASSVHPRSIAEAVRGVRALGIAGANVTIPHKERVLQLVDELTEEAGAVGAVNTIIVTERDEERVLAGDNTDIEGFLRPLQPYQDRLSGGRMLIFGSGGAARAVAYAIITTLAPAACTIAARTPEKAERLVADLAPYDSGNSLTVSPLQDASPAVRSSQLLVNATPVGMHPNVKETIWPETKDFHADQIAYDLVYRPRQTRWLREAADRGARTIGGLQMLIAQAAAAYRQWTGTPMPVEAVERAVTKKWR